MPAAHAEAPAEAQVPPKQPAQLEAPAAAWGVPSTQLMHEVAPFESWNMPGKHESHAALPVPETLPTALDSHASAPLAGAMVLAVRPVAAAPEYLPASQLVHAVGQLEQFVEPATGWKRPAA